MTVYVIQKETYDYRCDNSRSMSWNDWDDPIYVDCDYEEAMLKVAELNRELVGLKIADLKARIDTIQDRKADHIKSESVFNTFTEDQKILLAASVPNYPALYRSIEDEISKKAVLISDLENGKGGMEAVGSKYRFETLSLTRLEDIKNG